MKDTVHNFEGTVLACIVAAFEENPDELCFEVINDEMVGLLPTYDSGLHRFIFSSLSNRSHQGN